MLATAASNELNDQRMHHRVSGRGRVASSRPAVGEHHLSRGPGTRVSDAFNALNAFPALAESRNRLLSATTNGDIVTANVVSAIESDIALCIAVLRIANTREHGRGHVETAVSSVGLLRPQIIQALASRVHTFDFFERVGIWDTAPERFRLHALATQRAADRIAVAVSYSHRDRLAITSLLHDIGKLVLIHAYPGYPSQIHYHSMTPGERARGERAELGVDHAAIGGVLIRRWGLPVSLATAVAEHHNPQADGEPALLRLADMLAHHEQGEPIAPREMLRSARVIGLGPQDLRRLMYELPGGSSQRPIPTDPCPLTRQELLVLQHLGKGRVYKEIAHELGRSPSTIRSHLHNIYRKLGVANRAQAVLFATERGWL